MVATRAETEAQNQFGNIRWLQVGEALVDREPAQAEIIAIDDDRNEKRGVVDIEVVDLWEEEPLERYVHDDGSMDYPALPVDAIETIDAEITWDANAHPLNVDPTNDELNAALATIEEHISECGLEKLVIEEYGIVEGDCTRGGYISLVGMEEFLTDVLAVDPVYDDEFIHTVRHVHQSHAVNKLGLDHNQPLYYLVTKQ